MTFRNIMRLTGGALTVAAQLVLLAPTLFAQDAAPLSEVRVIVVDQSGAVIPNSEVMFKSDSETVVSHTGPDGRVTVKLPSGRYTVTTNELGFQKNELSDVQVLAPEPQALRVVLKVASTPIVDGIGPARQVPTTASDLSSVVPEQPEPAALPPARPMPQKIRSPRCLYLWKCSAAKN